MIHVLILNAYHLGGGSDPVASAFVDALETAGLRIGTDVDVTIHQSRSLDQHRELLRKRLAGPLELVYACGASLMEVAVQALREADRRDVALVYWGAHVVDQGRALNPDADYERVCGLLLTMPLYGAYRQFRLLKRLFPHLQRVYGTFCVDSAFVRDEVERNYQRARCVAGSACWIDSSSTLAGFPGLGKLGQIIDVSFFEHPCADASALAEAIHQLPILGSMQRDAVQLVLISCVDCLHTAGALSTMIRMADERRIPFVGLNLQGLFGQQGPLFSFENDFVAASRTVGEWAAQILQGTVRPEAIGLVREDHFRVRFDRAYAAARGYELPAAVRRSVESQFGPLVLKSPHLVLDA